MPSAAQPRKLAFRPTRRGAVIVLFAILLTVIVAMLAFGLDVGVMMSARTDLQRAVDAGALAGAGAMIDGQEAARAAVVDYVRQNSVGGTSVEQTGIDVEFGAWDNQGRTFAAGVDTPSAIRVIAAHNDRPLIFGRILGQNEFNVSAEAVAVYQPRDIMVVLDYSGSMNDDSELSSINVLGRSTVENNMKQIYEDLGSPKFGNLTWKGVSQNSNNNNTVVRNLGLRYVPYPYPSGSWTSFVKYVRTNSVVNNAGYRKKYGYLTFIQYLLSQQESSAETPDLWKTREQPITAVKNAVQVFLAYMQELDTDDQVGLAVYTHPNGGAIVEQRLTENMQLVEDISRQRQAGHYTSMTNIGAGIRAARLELEQRARIGAFKMIVLMTDGQANEPSNNPKGYVRQEAAKCAQNGYPIVTISLGSGADKNLMQEVADTTGGVHFNIPGGHTAEEYEEELKDVFKQIAAKRPLKLVK